MTRQLRRQVVVIQAQQQALRVRKAGLCAGAVLHAAQVFAQVAPEFHFQAVVTLGPRQFRGGLEAQQGGIGGAGLLVHQRKIAQGKGLQAAMADGRANLSSGCQLGARGLGLPQFVVQQAQVAMRVARPLPVTQFAGHLQGGAQMPQGPGLVAAHQRQGAQRPMQPAQPALLARLPGQRKNAVVMRLGLRQPPAVHLEVAQGVTHPQRDLVHITGQRQSGLQLRMCSVGLAVQQVQHRQPAHQQGLQHAVTGLQGQRQALRQVRPGQVVVAHLAFSRTQHGQHAGPLPGRQIAARGQWPGQVQPGAKWTRQAQRGCGIHQRAHSPVGQGLTGCGPINRGCAGLPAGCHQVVDIHTAVGNGLGFAQPRKVAAVAGRRGRAQCRQPFGRVVLHRAQQRKAARVEALHQRLLDQALQHISHPGQRQGRRRPGAEVQNSFTGRQRETAFEHRQLRQRALLGRVEQVPGPVQRGAQRGLAVMAATAAAQQPEAFTNALQLVGRRHHSRTRSGQLNGQRQTVQHLHQARQGRSVGRQQGGAQAGGLHALAEQLLGFGHAQWRQALQPFTVQAQHFAAGHQKAHLGQSAQPRAQAGVGMAGHLLEVVQQQQAFTPPGQRRHQLLHGVAAAQRHVQRLGYGLHHAVQRTGSRQVAEPGAAGVIAQPAAGVAQGQPGLAHAAGAQQGNQAAAFVVGLCQRLQGGVTAHEGIGVGAQVVGQGRNGHPQAVTAHHAVGLG